MSNTPQIRFAGFTDAWEQRKLGDHSEIVAGGTPNTGHPEYWNPKEIPWMSSGEINNKVIYSTDNMISKIGFSNSSAKWVKEKSVLIALAGQGKTRGTVAISEIPLTTNQSIAAIQPDSFLYYKFLFQNLEGRYNELREVSSGDGTRGGLNKQIISDLEVLAPEIQEQIKIGDFLCGIDNLITLHQREYFSFDFGSRSAKITQNTLSWEQRKVGDVLSESRDAGHSGDIAKKLTVKLWGKGVYAKNDKGSAATQYFTRHAGQFIYSKLDFLNSAFGVVPQELESYESTADLPAFDCIAVDPYFMFYRAIQPSFYLTNGMIADGSRKAKRIHVETFLDMPLDLPSIEEQKKVASYFTQLDSLITLHQHKPNKKRTRRFNRHAL